MMNGAAHPPRPLTRRQVLAILATLPFIPLTGLEAAPKRTGWAVSPPDVVLADSEGKLHDFRDLLARRSVAISFFYSRCTTVCPVQTALFSRAQDILLRRQSHGLLLSITLDPANDTPEVLHAYAARFKARLGLERNWLMLTGEGSALEQVWRVFDSSTGRPEDHASTLWIGSAHRQRWERHGGVPNPRELVDWMEASSQ